MVCFSCSVCLSIYQSIYHLSSTYEVQLKYTLSQNILKILYVQALTVFRHRDPNMVVTMGEVETSVSILKITFQCVRR